MSDQPRTRQELYDRIRQTSRDEFILEEMIRLGFWPAAGTLPEDPAEEIRRRGEIEREIQELTQQNRHLHNEEALKKELVKQRMAEAKRKRQETQERREQERQARAQAWQARKAQGLPYLGEGVSAGLNHTQGNPDRLRQYDLQTLNTALEIATAMGISLGQLRFLAFARRVSRNSHYIRFRIAKKTGGHRLISAPMPRLKQAQHWILDNILEKIPVHAAVHGFRRGRSILTNAQPHLRATIIVNRDLKDFFPSISYKRIKGVFQSLGYSEAAATIFALLCTEPEIETVELDGRTYFVALSDRHLPQGAPTSPALTNILCRRLDRRLTGLANQLGYTYTRYADDLTFSGPKTAQSQLCNLLKTSHRIIEHEGFTLHPNKTRILRHSQHQEVTGIVVNDKPNLDRTTLKRFRATLHHIEKDGPAGKHWGHSPNLLQAIEGFAQYLAMVNPDKSTPYLAQVKRIKRKYGTRKR